MSYPTPPPSSRQQLQQLQQQQQRLYDQQRRAQSFLSKQESMPVAPMQNKRVHFADERPTTAPLSRPVAPNISLTNTDIIGSSPKMVVDPFTQKAENAKVEYATGNSPVSTDMEAIMASLRIICVIALLSSVFALPMEYRTIWGVVITFVLIVITSSMLHGSLVQNGDPSLANAVIKTGYAVFFFGTIVVILFIAYKIYCVVRENQQVYQNQARSMHQQHHTMPTMMPTMMTSTSPVMTEMGALRRKKKKKKLQSGENRPFSLM